MKTTSPLTPDDPYAIWSVGCLQHTLACMSDSTEHHWGPPQWRRHLPAVLSGQKTLQHDQAWYRCLWKKHSSGEKENIFHNKLDTHRIRGWKAVSAAGLHGWGSPINSVSSTDTGMSCYVARGHCTALPAIPEPIPWHTMAAYRMMCSRSSSITSVCKPIIVSTLYIIYHVQHIICLTYHITSHSI